MRQFGYFGPMPMQRPVGYAMPMPPRGRSVGNWPPAYVGAAPGQFWLPPVHPAAMGGGLLGSIPGAGPAGAQIQSNPSPDTIGQYPMGLGPTVISPTATAGVAGPVITVTTRVQVKYFTITRFTVIDSTAAPAANFTIQAFFVGQKNVMLNANSIPGGAFTQTATDTLLSFVTAVAGQDIVVEISNLCTASQTFQGILIGRAVGA